VTFWRLAADPLLVWFGLVVSAYCKCVVSLTSFPKRKHRQGRLAGGAACGGAGGWRRPGGPAARLGDLPSSAAGDPAAGAHQVGGKRSALPCSPQRAEASSPQPPTPQPHTPTTLIKFTPKTNQPEPIPRRRLGILQVHQSRLSTALLPSPLRCISVIHGLLPELARAAYRAFTTEVRALVEAVERPPNSAEEFVAHLQLVRRVEGRRQELDGRHDHVSAAAAQLVGWCGEGSEGVGELAGGVGRG